MNRHWRNTLMLHVACWYESTSSPGCYRDPLSGKLFVFPMAVRIQKDRNREKYITLKKATGKP